MRGLEQKKAHIMEIQVNGGTVADKVRLSRGYNAGNWIICKLFCLRTGGLGEGAHGESCPCEGRLPAE